jgi:hypothetical protein
MSTSGLPKSKRPDLRSRFSLFLVPLGLLMGAIVPGICPAQPAAPASAATTGSRWVPTGNLNMARTGHTATLLANGKVLVVGNEYDGSAELYDPTTGTWSVTGSLNAAKSGHTATLLPNGQVLVVGEADSAKDSAELYDPETGRWSLTSGPPGHWRDHAAVLLRTGKVLVAGGWGEPYGSYSDAALYAPRHFFLDPHRQSHYPPRRWASGDATE